MASGARAGGVERRRPCAIDQEFGEIPLDAFGAEQARRRFFPGAGRAGGRCRR